MSRSNSISSQNKHRRSLAISNASVVEARTKSLIREKDGHINQLRNEVAALTNKLAKQQKHYEHLLKKNSASTSSSTQHTPKRKHKLSPFGNVVTNSNSSYGAITNERARMGRNASIATANELQSLVSKDDHRHESNQQLVSRILEMFKEPESHVQYLTSMEFAKDLLKLTKKIKTVLEQEPRVAFVQSPAYVFGDIHGNLEDLHFFSDNVWRLGMALTAGNFVFLGDYVDRGMSCLEVVAYLFSMKLLFPHKVFLLRGNHETRDVNGEYVFKFWKKKSEVINSRKDLGELSEVHFHVNWKLTFASLNTS